MEVGEILNIARIVVDPRQGHAFHIVEMRVPGFFRRRVVAARSVAEVEFVNVDVIESDVEVLLGAPFEELRLDLGIGYLCDDDGAELVEVSVADFAVEDNLARDYVGTVDMAEDVEVLRALAQRKSDG